MPLTSTPPTRTTVAAIVSGATADGSASAAGVLHHQHPVTGCQPAGRHPIRRDGDRDQDLPRTRRRTGRELRT